MISLKLKWLVPYNQLTKRDQGGSSKNEIQFKKMWIGLGWKHTLILSLLATLYIGSFWFQVRFNSTHSLPHYVYLVNKDNLPTKWDFASFSHPLYPEILIKRVVGVPGDQIELKNNNVYIEKQHICPLVDKNSKGEALTPIQEMTIPYGYYFVVGDHRRSFDSCYKAFGLVHHSQVEGRAWAIF